VVCMGFRNLYLWKRSCFIIGSGASEDDWYYWFCFRHRELLHIVIPLYCVVKWSDVYSNLCVEGRWENENFEV
jgi:hypothetical protein